MTSAKDQSGAQTLVGHFKNGSKPTTDQFTAAVKDIAQNGPEEMRDILEKMIKVEINNQPHTTNTKR